MERHYAGQLSRNAELTYQCQIQMRIMMACNITAVKHGGRQIRRDEYLMGRIIDGAWTGGKKLYPESEGREDISIPKTPISSISTHNAY